ncbi:MAG: hypothetical protein H0U23_15550, partial [Blastocatellia bacterium]|nr:hypothetical protein [Blastocatellia bacterium]
VPLADDDDLNTTAPSPQPDVWKMPEPVFRQTSGKLPTGYERTYSVDPIPATESATANEPTAADISNPGDSINPVEPKPKNPTLKFILVLLGLAAMIAFLIVFLTIVYFFFWRS